MFAATTAHTSVEVAALGEAAWGDGQLLVEIRSRHSALAAAATAIALTAAPTAIALAGRLNRAIEIWTAGVEEGQARSSMLLYSSSLGPRASAREWTGDLGGAEADAIAALALLPADDPIIRPSALSALVDVHIERGALEQAAAVVRDAWPTGELPLSLSISQALASRGRLALQMGDPAAALSDFEEAGRRARGPRVPEPVRADVAQLCGPRRWPASGSATEPASSSRRSSRSPGGSAPRSRSGKPSACARCSPPNADMVELAGEAAEVLAGSDLRLAHARALIDLGAALRRGGHRRDAREPLREGLDLANRCGSLVETDRAMDELRADRRAPPTPCVERSRLAVGPGAPRRDDGHDGTEQPRDRRSPLPHPPDGRDAPDRRIPQARRVRPGGAVGGARGSRQSVSPEELPELRRGLEPGVVVPRVRVVVTEPGEQ